MRRHFRTSAWGCTKVGILFSLITTKSLLLPPSCIGQFRVWSRFEISLQSKDVFYALSADCQLYRPGCFQGYSQPTPTQLLPRWVRSLDLVPAEYQMKPFGHHFWPVQICFSNALLIKVNNFKTLLSTDLCLGAFFRSLWTAKPGARVFSCLDAAVFPLDLRIPQALEQWLPNLCWLIILWSYTIHYYPGSNIIITYYIIKLLFSAQLLWIVFRFCNCGISPN